MRREGTATRRILLLLVVVAIVLVPVQKRAGAVTYTYRSQYFDPGGVAPMYPAGGVADASGNRYIADSGGDRIIRIGPGGGLSVVSATGWHRPRDLTFDPSTGRLWVADTTDNQIVSLETDGTILSIFGGGQSYTRAPFGIVADATGVYVADTYNGRVFKIRKSDGAKLWTQTACQGALSRPRDVTVGSDGNVYAADTDHNRIVALRPETGACIRSFGSGGAGPGQFRAPRSLASDGGGGLWVAEAQSPRLQHITNLGAALGTGGSYGSGPGKFRAPACVFTDGPYVDVCDTFEYVIQRFTTPDSGSPVYVDSLGGVRPVTGGFNEPFGVAFGPNGELYVSDMFNHRMQRRAPGGAWTEWGGFGTRQGSFQFPRGLDVSADGNTVVVTNSENNRIDLYRPDGTLIRSIRPSGTSFGWPHQTALAKDGTFWVADTYKHRVLHLSSTGTVLDTISQGIKTPRGIALDGVGNVYVANSGVNRVEKYNASGNLLAVLATSGTGPTNVRLPWNLDVSDGLLYIADGTNNRVVVMTTSGSPVATFGSSGSGPGRFSSPRSVSVDPVSGTVAVGDFNNDRVSLWSSP